MNQVDIIIPTKNEAKSLPALVQRIHQALTSCKQAYNLIIVDDKSTDDTEAIVKQLSKKYPIKLHRKWGPPGKAYSILEGAALSTSEYVVMCDADLQYPPEAICEMLKLIPKYGVIVANRKVYKSSFFRRFASRFNSFVFGRLLFGLRCDVQSGLKLFRRDIIDHLDIAQLRPWSLDIPLLYTAVELGYKIGAIDITFEDRSDGKSKLHFFQAAFQIVTSALLIKFSTRPYVYHLAPNLKGSMQGAGLVHQRRRYITHTTLKHYHSALETFSFWQKIFFSFVLGIVTGGSVFYPYFTIIAIIALLSSIYFIDVLFSLFVTVKSLHTPPEIEVSSEELERQANSDLPIYSVLCPLYREAHVLPQFLHAMSELDWPKNKLQVLLLLEEDDRETQVTLGNLSLPSYIQTVIVPHSQPKSKPKACNFGLSKAKGDFVVIYDAEDIPEPAQLKKAYLAFKKVAREVACLQAKLNYYNPHQNLLTRLFTAEYSLWFDVILPGLQSIETTIPLGGTSNHFKKETLSKLEGWDAFNVAEDCDLGVRLFKAGYKTAIFNSTTLEEANSQFINWLRQRSRWIKGYLQTYFVHIRHPLALIRTSGIHGLIFHLVIGLRITFMLINPVLWLTTFSYFAFYHWVGPAIESVYPTPVFYMAIFSLIFGNFLYLYNYMLGCIQREHWSIVKYIFLVPVYWLMLSCATVISLIQLVLKPHYWEKTHHGLHLGHKKPEPKLSIIKPKSQFGFVGRARRGLVSTTFTTSTVLVGASLATNFFSFLFNAYVSRVVSIEEFGTLSLVSNILLLGQIPLYAFTSTVTFRSAYLLGKFGSPVKSLWSAFRKMALLPTVVVVLLWLVMSPFMANFFHTQSVIPFLLLTPFWAVGLIYSADSGFLTGNLRFLEIAAISLVEILTKFWITYVLASLGYNQWIYVSFSVSIFVSFLLTWLAVLALKTQKYDIKNEQINHFPKRFFISSLSSKVAILAFLSADVLLAKHYLSPTAAGQYALLSLVGKMIYFLGALFNQFVIPLVSRAQGSGKNSGQVFTKLLLLTLFTVSIAFVAFGIYGYKTVPLLYGPKTLSILHLIPFYGFAMACFAITHVIVAYHQSRQEHIFSYVNAFFVVSALIGISFYHQSIASINLVVTVSGIVSLLGIVILHILYPRINPALTNFVDFIELFTNKPLATRTNSQSLRILIFNWRDTRHVWAGGAEVYIHEISKRWVSLGHEVTMFCGNDGKNPRNEMVDGVQIVRRGGHYTVYFWAFVYYILRFRGSFDVVVESINGVPFCTPLFARVPTILLIHHIHQEVFRNHLPIPLSWAGMLIESKLTPRIYKNHQVMTISESSKKEIVRVGVSKPEQIEVVVPGVDPRMLKIWPKTIYPSFVYLGRLKDYKNVDTAIRAFAQVLQTHPKAKLVIAGDGEARNRLKKLAKHLGITSAIEFLGSITEAQKRALLGESWVLIQPSSIEGWGITVIEASASGTTVVASRVHGLKDSVQHGRTGLLVPVKNDFAFAKAMNTLIDDSYLRKQLSRQARRWSQSFDWDKSAQQFLLTIERTVLSGRSTKFQGRIWALGRNRA